MWELLWQALIGEVVAQMQQPPPVEPGMTHEMMMAHLQGWTQAILARQETFYRLTIRLIFLATGWLSLLATLFWLNLRGLSSAQYQRGYEAGLSEARPTAASSGKILGV